MTDRQISAGCAVAYLLWAAVVALLGLAWLMDNDDLGRIGLASSAAAATATIRQYFVASNRLIRAAVGMTSMGDTVRPMR